MEVEENISKNKRNNPNNKSITLKILVDEAEASLIKGKLNQYNESFRNNKFYKDKSMSEFLRETVLNSLLNVNNKVSDVQDSLSSDLELKINQIEKYTMRSITLTFENIIKSFGEDEARKILKKAKLDVIKIDDKAE